MKSISNYIKQGCSIIICVFITISVVKCFFSNPLEESNVSSEYIEGCKSACNSDDFEEAHKYLTKILNDYEQSFITKRVFDTYHVISITGYVYEKEINFLFSKNDIMYHQRVIHLLKEFPIYGESVGDGMIIGSRCNEFNEYISWCAKYNEMCDHALDLAIIAQNMEVARNIVLLFKRMPGEDNDTAKYSDAPQEEAQKKYQNAVENGTFDN